MANYSNERCNICNKGVHPINGEVCERCGEFFCSDCYLKHINNNCKKSFLKRIKCFFK
ncbi:hypothetical protein [Clostridium perfringens]|uniref:hypothetical protein n=1 Tax=Clostridium perfringens TaxID=1502 RepID=UPI00156FAF9E|nr:hypothetical protein [Clostridium perfringens]MDU7977737.1 hypothetical protein [Clostridioides difficile]EGT0689419.1 hypothetical protein [Clostridium perfringens]EGT0692950.1 hypothetical protein [Clostridium perfringens]EGT0696311.1 hypothetical protein [Clostridium perfringens]MBI6024434.1 hypothetical protein [Clostridium perfringens]